MSESVFNEGSIDVDFRVEGNGVTHAFFVEGETDRVGIGTNDPGSLLELKGTGETQIYINSASGSNSGVRLLENGTNKWTIGHDQSDDSLFFYDFGASATRFSIDSSGNPTFIGDGVRLFVKSADEELISIGRAGSSGPALDQGYIRMKSGGTNKIAFHTAGDSYINGGSLGIGTDSPQALTHIKGADTVVSGTYGEQLIIEDTAAYNAAQYAGISFKAQYHSNGSVAHIAQIVGDRPDTGSGTYNGQLYFLTRTSGSDLEKALTLDYNQNATFEGNVSLDGYVFSNGATNTGRASRGNVFKSSANGNAAITLLSPSNISAGVGADMVALNFAANNYWADAKDSVYGQIRCEGGDGTYADRGQLVFATGYNGATINDRMIITSAGNVGIGDTSPGQKLTVVTDAASGYAASFHNDTSNSNRYGIRVLAGTDDGSGVNYHYSAMDGDGDLEGALRVSSGTFALYDNSDRRLKDNIRDTKINGTDIVNSMKVRDFEWKKSGLTETAGFVAQELKESFEPASPDSEDDLYEDKPKMMAVSRDRLVPVLVKAIQELSAQVTALEGN